MTEGKYDYTIFDSVSQHFDMLIGKTMIFLYYHKKGPQIINRRLISYVIGRNFIPQKGDPVVMINYSFCQ